MIVLGISPLDKDATVTLMIDGRVVSAVAEERLSRQKMHSGFPYQALEMVMRQGRIEPRDVDCVAYAFFDARTEQNLMRREVGSDWRLNRVRPPKKLTQLIAEARGRLKRRDLHVPGLASGEETM
jgi:carbamoyltransferase